MNENGINPVSCRRCEAVIFFAVTTKNKRIPLDIWPNEHGNIILGEPQQPYGLRLAMVLGKADVPKPVTERYTSHFATCPAADSFRKSR